MPSSNDDATLPLWATDKAKRPNLRKRCLEIHEDWLREETSSDLPDGKKIFALKEIIRALQEFNPDEKQIEILKKLQIGYLDLGPPDYRRRPL